MEIVAEVYLLERISRVLDGKGVGPGVRDDKARIGRD